MRHHFQHPVIADIPHKWLFDELPQCIVRICMLDRKSVTTQRWHAPGEATAANCPGMNVSTFKNTATHQYTENAFRVY